MAKKKTKYDFVEILWLDAEDTPGWVKPEDLPLPPQFLSRGWLVKTTEDSYYLAGSMGINRDEYGTIMQVPKGMVKKIEKWPKLTK